MADQFVGPDRPKQSVGFHTIERASLVEILGLPDPVFVGAGDPWRQLAYVETYVRELGCETVVLEQHYIDRDHMEDHSVFYSKNLRQYRNSCQRLHFFSLGKKKLEAEIRRLRTLALPAAASTDAFMRACEEFSRSHYIGFAVIKPLPGCPVGRTLLRCLPADSGKGHRRHLDCASDAEAHLLGVRLTVSGLPFQQQDLGVSACATTALWTSLQRARQLEQFGSVTPAQITIRASQFALPFGRSMPSEGLSLDQMCQAVHSLGYSPTLYRIEGSSEWFDLSRALLQSSVSSGISPVVIMRLPGEITRHAVAVAGTAIADPIQPPAPSEMRHSSADLVALYIHDDRFGPYLKAEIANRKNNFLLRLSLRNQDVPRTEEWVLTHILIPIHAKIRLSFRGVYTAGLKIVCEVQAFAEARLGVENPAVSWSSRIVRSHSYIESLLRDKRTAPLVDRLCRTVPLPRYVGVLHVEAGSLDPFDVLLDTTSTERNLNCPALVRFGNSHKSSGLYQFIARRYQCEVFD